MENSKKMFLAKTKDGKKHWIKNFKDEMGFLTFERETKAGKMFKIYLNKNEILEIIQTELKK